MKRRVLAAAMAALTGSGASSAHAAFHLWDVSEVYTNADGSVQFIELFTSSSGQQFLSGHFIRTEEAGEVLQSFEFPSNLATPPSTANEHFLIATPGFETVAGVAPDYVFEGPGFIEVGVADSINFADWDSFSLAGLPMDGVNALYDGGVVDAASPTNFAGDIGTIVPEPGTFPLGLAVAGVLSFLAGLRRDVAPSRR